MYCLNDITGVCGTFPCRHLILKVLYPVPTLLVGVPPSATDKGQPELINEGRMLADKKENVRFIFADKENWKRKSGRTMSVCAWSTVEWFQGSCPNCTLYTAVNQAVAVLEWQSLT